MKNVIKACGYIQIGAKLVKASLIRKNTGGSYLVRLEEDAGAYRIGDKVNVKAYQFVKE